jgi:hypothetical protein
VDEFGDMTTWPEGGGRRAEAEGGRSVRTGKREDRIFGSGRYCTGISPCVFPPTASLSPSANSKHQCGLARRIFSHHDLLYLLRRRTNKNEPPEQAEA